MSERSTHLMKMKNNSFDIFTYLFYYGFTKKTIALPTDDEERTTIQLIENEWVRVTGKDSVAELMLAAGAYYAQENNLA